MKQLVKLFFLKKWAWVRNVFSKPVSAIIMVVLIGLFGFSLVPLFTDTGSAAHFDESTFLYMEWLMLALLLMFFCSLFLTKHKALFFLQDSYFMFTGPFTQKQVLRYLLFEVGISALMLGGISGFTVLIIGGVSGAPGLLLLNMLVPALLVGFILTAVMDFIYLRGLVRGRAGKGFWPVVIGLVAVVAVIFAVTFVTTGMSFSAAAQSFLSGQLFYAVPVFGWAKLVMDSAHTFNLLGLGIGYALLLAGCIIPALLLVHTKGDFYEQAMLDAENFTEYYQKAKEGKADEMTRTAAKASVRFKKGAGAIFSKNWLMAKKQRFIRMQDLLIVGIYTVMAIVLGYGFIGLCFMLFIWLLISVGNSTLVDDLKHHYIYLVPARPLAKLLAALLVPMLKTALLLTASVAVSTVAMGEDVLFALCTLVMGFSFILIMNAGTVVSVRLMKSRNNLMVEQTLRMLVVLLGAAPGLGILLLLVLYVSLSAPVMLLIITLFNILVSLGVLALCSPMMNGRELGAD